MRFKQLSDLKLMRVYESDQSLSLKSIFYFFIMLLIIDLAFRWDVWIGVVLSVVLFLSFLNYQLKLYSLSKQLEKEIYRRNIESMSKVFQRGS